MGLLSKIVKKISGPELSDSQLNEGAKMRPALAFDNHRGGPNYIQFDAVEFDKGMPLLILDLQGASLRVDGQTYLLSALDAIDQNSDVRCQLVLLESDLEAFGPLLSEASVSHSAALSRVELLVGKPA